MPSVLLLREEEEEDAAVLPGADAVAAAEADDIGLDDDSMRGLDEGFP